MSNPIGPYGAISPLIPLENKNLIKESQIGAKDQEGFSSFMKDALNKLEDSQREGEQAAIALVTGQTDDFHTPVIAMEKASLTLGLAVTVRNKVLEAYHEIMRMQI